MSGSHSPLDVLEGTASWCVVEGDALQLLRELPDASVRAIVTDPPYSSGGMFRGDRTKDTDSKYTNTEFQGKRPSFAGDSRDQRSWAYWCALWMSECHRVADVDARLVVFSDWRQLPACTDAVQSGGWIWRGIAAWDKGRGCRPTPGGFAAQCEYIVWASNGPLPPSLPGVGCFPGAFHEGIRTADKHHQTGKPTALMRQLLAVVPPGEVVLDPFGGSGTTVVAAVLEGRRVIICEKVPAYADIARRRLAAAEVDGANWQHPEQSALALTSAGQADALAAGAVASQAERLALAARRIRAEKSAANELLPAEWRA